MERILWLSVMILCWLSGAAQSYRLQQVLSYSDSAQTKVVIQEFLVYDSSTGRYQPYEISADEFYQYKKNPLGVRYFNFGCIKTKSSGYWYQQIDKDKFGHAIFKTPLYGIKAMVLLSAEMIEERGKTTLYKFFNTYAPDNDCVGSIKNRDGSCTYGYNHPEQYAKKVGDKLGLSVNDLLDIRDERGNYNTKLLTVLLSEVASFETGIRCRFAEKTIIEAVRLLERT